MEQIKLSLRIASIIGGIFIYGAIWILLINNYDIDEDARECFLLWIAIHVVAILRLIAWAWY